MIQAYINRYEKTQQGSFGIFSLPEYQFSCYSLELPYKNNMHSISCIPTGDYICRIYKSPKFGYVFHLLDVQKRSYILIHPGNFAGDISKGWKTNSHGCILLGKSRGIFMNQKVILNSRITIKKIQRLINNEKFLLHIS